LWHTTPAAYGCDAIAQFVLDSEASCIALDSYPIALYSRGINRFVEQIMSTVAKVMKELKKKGNPLRIQTFAPHGAPDNIFGVSVADLKVIAKTIKGEQDLACELYDSGNSDAMYLAGIVADGSQMTKKQLNSWAKNEILSSLVFWEFSLGGFLHDSVDEFLAL
jgi:hypothetical protein